ncbi:MAG: diguanylate cyclase [Desulfobacterales bacterium]
MDAKLITIYEKETGAHYTDSLTGLLNHGFFEMALNREFKRSERYGEPFTLALIDVDSFNHYNRRHSSVAGDRLLREIAGLITKNIRQIDLAARYSGDVLEVVFIKSNTQSALVPLERIRQAVEKKYGGDPTISVGLASYPNDAATKDLLTEKAYKALLQAKIGGKNKVVFYEKESPTVASRLPKILVVDDEPRNVKLLEAILRPLNYEVIKAFNGEDALTIINKVDVDLVLLDVMMPLMDGYEVCRRLKASEATRLIPVVMVTALDSVEDKINGIEAGADDFLTKPPNKMELRARTKSLINLKKLNDNLTSIEQVLFSLANTVDAKDTYTQGHVERVSNMAMTLGHQLALSASELQALRYGGALHDIGKIGVPDDIINKRGPLDPEEWNIMKSHPDLGFKICMPLRRNLKSALDVIRYHHEKLDGSGYPDGLKGEQISTVVRIMAVVDIFDALITGRSYRKAMPCGKALEILRNEAEEGKLDQEIVRNLEILVSSNKIDH